jgi:hypothetical protein
MVDVNQKARHVQRNGEYTCPSQWITEYKTPSSGFSVPPRTRLEVGFLVVKEHIGGQAVEHPRLSTPQSFGMAQGLVAEELQGYPQQPEMI